MATPKYAERVAVLETKFDNFSVEVFKEFREVKGAIEAASLNGQTPRVKNLATKLGDPEDVEILAMVVESHRRRTWLFAPLKSIPRGVVNAALWIATAGALAMANTWLHGIFPTLP